MMNVMEMKNRFSLCLIQMQSLQVHLEIGMKFDTLDIFNEVVRNYTIYHGRNIKWLKNNKQ